MLIDTATCPLNARIAEPEKTSVVKQWLCKHVSTATKVRDRNRYTHNNTETVTGGVVYCDRVEVMLG
jgi:hypothetical protein